MSDRIMICKRHQKRSGFTLVEFLITMTIAAIFLTIAVPSYYSMMQNNRVITFTNGMSAAFNFARIEAIKRGVRVSVCSASSAALTSCGNATQWNQGWIVFIDSDNNNQVDATTNLAKVNEAAPDNVNITASSNIVSYDGSGFVTSGSFTMTLTATSCTGYNARSLSITSSGRLSIGRTAC